MNGVPKLEPNRRHSGGAAKLVTEVTGVNVVFAAAVARRPVGGRRLLVLGMRRVKRLIAPQRS